MPPSRPQRFDVLSLVHTTCASISWGFLLACSITSPALQRSGFLYYDNTYHQYSFGVLGYCDSYLRVRPCTTQLGYSIYGLFQKAIGEGGHSTPLDITYSYLTKYLILIPIAAVVAFVAAIISVVQHRRGRILFSSSILSILAFCFAFASLIMEELLFNQLYGDVKKVGGATVSHGIPRYLLIISVITTFVAAATGFVAARRAPDSGRYASTTNFDHPMPLAPYANLDKQDTPYQSSLLTADGAPARAVSPLPHLGYDPAGTQDGAFDMPTSIEPSPTSSPGPYSDHNPYDHNPYSHGRY